MTVLFADVKGSMELAEQLDPEQWHTILDRFFAILTEGVHRFEGTVNQYTGDGIMALFGVLRTLVQHGAEDTVALIEDLHWIDGASAAWLEERVDAMGATAQAELLAEQTGCPSG